MTKNKVGKNLKEDARIDSESRFSRLLLLSGHDERLKKDRSGGAENSFENPVWAERHPMSGVLTFLHSIAAKGM